MAGAWLSRKDFESLVREALRELPTQFRRRLQNVAIEIEEEPSNETLNSVGMADDESDELLGLYVGRSIQQHSFFDTGGELPDQVYLYRGPILRACETQADVIREIQDTVVHEIGHHFGLSDEDMPV
ncbi:MAG TPA: metallopeptidase family protein [Nitrospirales bacterium]|jgi:predicted Zn-dependent protease with MMP-like domain